MATFDEKNLGQKGAGIRSFLGIKWNYFRAFLTIWVTHFFGIRTNLLFNQRVARLLHSAENKQWGEV